jgi:cation-transporting ATPase E
MHTAMIGDGVNDVPAIKQDDLGIAMDEGAAITREVADIILLKNRFTLLPQVFEEGNRIVNTASAVSKLFLTKSFLVVPLALMAQFPLTPRRLSLFNVFAIGIPAMVIAFSNRDTSRVRRFLAEQISYVSIAATVTVACGYVAFVAARSGDIGDAAMVMVSVMVLASVANFLVVVRGGARYWALAAAMVVVYAIGVTVTGGGWPMRLVRAYYEIVPLPFEAWPVIALWGAVAAVALAAGQWAREKAGRFGYSKIADTRISPPSSGHGMDAGAS